MEGVGRWEERWCSTGDAGGACCRGERLFCLSLHPMTASALPSLPGVSRSFPQGSQVSLALPAALSSRHLVLPMVSRLLRKSCSGGAEDGIPSPRRCGNRGDGEQQWGVLGRLRGRGGLCWAAAEAGLALTSQRGGGAEGRGVGKGESGDCGGKRAASGVGSRER